MNPFYTKIVGVTHTNPDGSSRQKIIAQLSPGDALRLVDMSSAQFPEAIGVITADGRQCGFLRSELARDIRREYAVSSSSPSCSC